MIFEHKTVLAAKERRVNLLFSGWGGDEFISIGNRGVDADLIRQFDWTYFLKKYPIQKPRNLLRALIYSVFFPSIRRTYSKYKTESTIYPYIKKWIGSNLIPKKERFKYNSRRRVHLQLLEMGHLGARTADWYVHGQRNAMAYRYPLLDKRIIEYMLALPSRCLVGNIHYRILLREIGKEVLPEEVLKNTSKDDPIKSKQFYKIANGVKNQLIAEFDDFKNNPDLAFVDFELLEHNLPTILKNIKDQKEEDGADIFYGLKSVHEFTKGYYN
jgi:asparagine synthase (glutamine-hydrolysing)